MPVQPLRLIAPLALVLVGSLACTPPAEDETLELTGTTWELQQILFNDGQVLVPDPPQNYTAEFSDNSEVFAQADCNRAIGSYTVEENRLTVTMGPTTLAACPPGSIGTEYLDALNNANSFFFRDENLVIEMKFDSGSLVFSPGG